MAGSIKEDSQKMNEWGLGDVLQTVLENEKEKREHEREMEKLNRVQNIQQPAETADNTSSNMLDNNLIKYGGVIAAALLTYKLLS